MDPEQKPETTIIIKVFPDKQMTMEVNSMKDSGTPPEKMVAIFETLKFSILLKTAGNITHFSVLDNDTIN